MALVIRHKTLNHHFSVVGLLFAHPPKPIMTEQGAKKPTMMGLEIHEPITMALEIHEPITMALATKV